MESLLYKPLIPTEKKSKVDRIPSHDYSFTIKHFQDDFLKPAALGRMKLGKPFKAPEKILNLIRNSTFYALPLMLSNP